MKLRHEINILDQEIGVTTDLNQRIYIDTTKFTATCTWYFEVVAKNVGSTSESIYLRTDDGWQVTISVPANTNSWTRIRSSSFTPDDNYKEKRIEIVNSNITCLAARVIILQNTSTSNLTDCETQIEIGDYGEALFTSTAIQPLAYPKYWYYDSSKWDGTVTVYGEVTWQCISDKYWLTVYIEEDDGSFANWTQVSTVLNQGGSETVTRTRGADFSAQLTSGRNYRLAIATEGTKASYGINIFNAKIVIQQTSVLDSYSGIYTLAAPLYTDYPGISQSFTSQNADNLKSAKFRLYKYGSPIGSVYAKLYTHSGTYGTSSVPDSLLATSDAVDVSMISSSAVWVEFIFSTSYMLSASTYYCIAIEYFGGDTDNKITAHGIAIGSHSGNYGRLISSWTANSNYDIFFYVYGAITKLEPQYLLVNTGKVGTGLQDYDQLYDANEWDGVTVDIYPEHDASGASSNTKLQEDPNGTPSDVSNSSITGANRVRGGTALSITDDETIDTNIVVA